MKWVVRITGGTRKFMPISFVKLVRQTTGEGLAPAKNRLDLLTAGETIEVEFQDKGAAEAFAHALTGIGAIATASSL
jgi:hypothetical protein